MPDEKTEGERIVLNWWRYYESDYPFSLESDIDSALAAKDAEIERLKKAIDTVEFGDSGGVDGPGYCCVCGGRKSYGHNTNCELAALLKEPTNDHHT